MKPGEYRIVKLYVETFVIDPTDNPHAWSLQHSGPILKPGTFVMILYDPHPYTVAIFKVKYVFVLCPVGTFWVDSIALTRSSKVKVW